ncbi:type I polyketide synthase [Streptomyces roseifaciens]|uniref:type I polyketide synthase n=1 Tax=Streptomyces roseifaciens TaxID=1488406 RepID=UPI000717FFCD|nr:type I polyketide synthase [Streptomyces roseifaciens]
MTEIAIVGIDGRFPGAANPAEFWDLLMRGADAISTVPDDRWDPDALLGSGRLNTTTGGFLTDPDVFDHEFFGISPKEAEAMDPQQRLMVQVAWRALEDACLDPRAQAGTATAVFIGVMGNEWAHLHMTDYDRITPHLGSGNGYCMIANRLSYLLDLKGPSWAVDSACSSSLVAVHQACSALRLGECDQAIVGGVNIMMTPALNIFYTQAGLSAPDSACKPFSAEANGIVRGEAVAAVVLRRLADAEAAGLPIYGVITGSAVNQDGRSNGLTAPNRWSQEQVIRDAYRKAGVGPEQIAAVEAHGTGTVLGDMIEANALGAVHGVDRPTPCGLGSLKGNIGHTEGAAGISALIKMALAAHHGVVPSSRHADTENPQLALRAKGLRLLKAPQRLKGTAPLLAVSSFGLGGTNAHLVLRGHRTTPLPERPAPGIVTLSANSSAGLQRNATQLATDLAKLPERSFARLCWTSNQVKSTGKHRLAFAASGSQDAAAALRRFTEDPAFADGISDVAQRDVRVGWLFTGQGSPYPGMTRALHDRFAGYRQALADVDQAMAEHLGRSVSSVILGEEPLIQQTGLAQPAIFAVGYAMSVMLSELGVQPDWLIGHSVGEFAAAVHAGVLALPDACELVTARARLMQELPSGGGMLAVRGEPAEVLDLLDGTVGIAALNGPEDTVCSGPVDELERIAKTLQERGITTRTLDVSHAFHSPLMEPMLAEFAAVAVKFTYRPATIPVYSTLYGRELTAGELMDAGYWTEHARNPVRWADAMAAAQDRRTDFIMELGPRRVLGPMARRARQTTAEILTPCPGPAATGLEPADVIARLARAGSRPTWDALYDADQQRLVRLTPYRFAADSRFWTTAGNDRPRAGGTTTRPHHAEPSAPKQADIDDVHTAVLAILGDISGHRPTEISVAAHLGDELGFDSIMVVQLKAQLERQFGIAIDAVELLAEIETSGDLITYLRRQPAHRRTVTR